MGGSPGSRVPASVPSSEPDPASTVSFSLRPRGRPARAHVLSLVQGDAAAPSIALTAEPLVLGRDPARPFHLIGSEVSRSHCELRLVGERVLVRDLGSTNGTFVDGARVENPSELPPGSLLQIGAHALRHDLLTPEELERRAQLAADMDRARNYVAALIPPPLRSGAVRTEWCFQPSSVIGGDALGYHALPGGRFALYVVDACGHGVDSALQAASVVNALRSQSLAGADFADPASVLVRLGAAFPMEDQDGRVLTIWYGVLDPAQGTLRFASAGHPPALALGADGRTLRRLWTPNPPIGVLGNHPVEPQEAPFRAGERLYVFSDGIYELLDAAGQEHGLEDFERELLAAADRSPGEPERLYRRALEVSAASTLRDDFTLLVVTTAG